MDDFAFLPTFSSNPWTALRGGFKAAPYSRPASLPVSPWVAASLLQKAIRRARLDLSLQAAATLLQSDPRRLWRRLACIGAEDVGIGGLSAFALATACLEGSRRRSELAGGDDWAAACRLVSALSSAPKCRSADDLALVCATHPQLKDSRNALGVLSRAELIKIVVSDEPLVERAGALWRALGGDWRSRSGRRFLRRDELEAVFNALNGAGLSPNFVECARQSHRRLGEALGPFLLLLSQEAAKTPASIQSDRLPEETMIGAIPSWAYDLFCREGRAALARFERSDAASAVWLRKRVRSNRRLAFLGHIVFRVEGGLVANRMCWPLGDWLREEADRSCCGPECPDGSEILDLVRADIPRLNQIRAESIADSNQAQAMENA